MPGFLGTPAGITTTSMSFRQFGNSLFPVKCLTFDGVLMWLRSAATPLTFAMSYKWRSETKGDIFIRSDSGCPMPPAAPRIATLNDALI